MSAPTSTVSSQDNKSMLDRTIESSDEDAKDNTDNSPSKTYTITFNGKPLKIPVGVPERVWLQSLAIKQGRDRPSFFERSTPGEWCTTDWYREHFRPIPGQISSPR
ncbi:uncharacterized protein I206_103640 [Kwoniella pini CBS 10737]|uniref:Uncharacterized protein n=1 Tax=Kwoniella pini CBS 10737 TaxID=1296096 RepID=A0A1B9I9A9_9TREE|nr:uncharacterized protein I206_01358 [Kwoniella pini CBS 10737]OCF52073.1 hypothetical protein I206_01358 [Kwoniella pini CBS 10737]